MLGKKLRELAVLELIIEQIEDVSKILRGLIKSLKTLLRQLACTKKAEALEDISSLDPLKPTLAVSFLPIFS